jgi:predicted Abi (CAAX) family protease
MAETTLSLANELIGGAFSLNSGVFQSIAELPGGLKLAIILVTLAGLSLAVGQSIILFINQVKPVRFVFSLLLNAILFVFGFLFLVFSTWLIGRFFGSVRVPFSTLVRVLGLGYVPLLFSFLGALPYAGFPILRILSIWNLLAMVVGLAAITDTVAASAFVYVAFGWFVKEILENTVGQPIARFGQWLASIVAGVELEDSRSALAEKVQTRFMEPASPLLTLTGSGPASTQVRQFMQSAGRSSPQAAQAVAQAVSTQAPTAKLTVSQSINPQDPMVKLKERTSGVPQVVKLAIALLSMVILFIVVAILLRPIRDSVFGWYRTLPGLFRLIFDLVWIGVVAIVFAGLLAPLETMGWWAGWYGDPVETSQEAGATPRYDVETTRPDGTPISRFVVYLDGIGQSGEEYTPDVEDFLDAFKPALPKDMELVQGLMMYSVLNKPLDEDRPLAFVWRLADKMRWSNPAAILGLMLNLRNVFIVAVSADKRYGPIYNQGIAQVIYNGLIKRGYIPGSGTPLTLIGYSGGGQMSVASGPYLRQVLGCPVEVISLGGVMSANNNVLKLEHLYHVVGDKDAVERVGPVMFPGRWKLFPLSFWNRAKRKGKISIISAGPVGHQVPGGYMDPKAVLPDDRTNLQHTIEMILKILRGEALEGQQPLPRKNSNYALFKQSPFSDPACYPITQVVNSTLYQPIAPWMGRLILPKPEERPMVQGSWFEVYHADAGYEHLVGQKVILRFANEPLIQQIRAAVTKDIHFSADAAYSSEYGGLVHPDRLNHWRQVLPLESLAGAHPYDDMVVKLEGMVEVEPGSPPVVRIRSTPVEITGRFYALVKFISSVSSEQFRVVHFNATSRQFDGPEEVVVTPATVVLEAYGSHPSTMNEIERSPLNEVGWYIYGAKDRTGNFVVQSLCPRSLHRLQPERVVFGSKNAYRYIRKEAWADAVANKGKISSVLCTCRDNGTPAAIQAAIEEWQEGDRALMIHTYGGIGGKKKEPSAGTPIFFGHFAYGLARVVREPLANELRFDVQYYQVYTHNTDGLTAGTLHWSRYMGDRQLGWAGSRPTCDLVIKLDSFTATYEVGGVQRSPLTTMITALQGMTAVYRTGNGTGGTYVGPANNCSQDSNQALFASITNIGNRLREHPQAIQQIRSNPEQAARFDDLLALAKELKQALQPLGGPRADWEKNELNLGTTLEDNPLHNLRTGLGSWRTMFPRVASDAIVKVFLNRGASVWVLRTNQIGGYDPDIEPIVPTTL